MLSCFMTVIIFFRVVISHRQRFHVFLSFLILELGVKNSQEIALRNLGISPNTSIITSIVIFYLYNKAGKITCKNNIIKVFM